MTRRAARYDGGMNAVIIFLVALLVLSILWAGGYIKLGGVASLYRRIRLVALLWAAAILVIGAMRIFGIG